MGSEEKLMPCKTCQGFGFLVTAPSTCSTGGERRPCPTCSGLLVTPAADEVGAVAFLRDLADRLCKVPCTHHDGHDIDRLRELASALQARSAEQFAESAKCCAEPVQDRHELDATMQTADRLARRMGGRLVPRDDHTVDAPDMIPAEPAGEEPVAWRIDDLTAGGQVCDSFTIFTDREKVEYHVEKYGVRHTKVTPLYALPAPTNPERLVGEAITIADNWLHRTGWEGNTDVENAVRQFATERRFT